MSGFHAATVTRCDSRANFSVCPCCGYNAAGEPFDVCLCRGYSATAMSPFDGGEQQVTLQRDPTHAMQYAIQCSILQCRQGRQYWRYLGRETDPAGADALRMMDHLRALHASLISKWNPVNLKPDCLRH